MRKRTRYLCWGAIGAWWFLMSWRNSVRISGTRYFSLFDDAMISMRYASNFAHGHGLVWNAGDAPVEGYTNLLWTLWMALLHVSGLPQAVLPLLVSSTSSLLVVACALIIRDIALRVYQLGEETADLAAISVAALYSLSYWSIRGMEVGLVVALVLVGTRALLLWDRDDDSRHIAVASAASALLPLVRIDTLPFPLMFAAFIASRRRFGLAVLPVAAMLVSAATITAFRLSYYGDSLPNTYYLKMTGVSTFARLARGLRTLLIEVPSQLVLPIGLILAGWRQLLAAGRRATAFLLVLVLSQCAYTLYIGGDAWGSDFLSGRFIAGVTPILVLLSFLAAAQISQRTVALLIALAFAMMAVIHAWPLVDGRSEVPFFMGRANPLRLGCAALLLVSATGAILFRDRIPTHARALAVALWITASGPAFARWIVLGTGKEDRIMTATGVALRDAAKGNSIGVVWAGAVSYWSDLQSYDILGKSDRHIAHMPSGPSFIPGHSKLDLDYTLGMLKPDIIPSGEAGDFAAAAARWGYVRISNGFWVRTAAMVDTTRLAAVPSFAKPNGFD